MKWRKILSGRNIGAVAGLLVAISFEGTGAEPTAYVMLRVAVGLVLGVLIGWLVERIALPNS